MADHLIFHATADGKTPTLVGATAGLPVSIVANTSTGGGVAVAKVTAAASTNATLIKASPGQLTSWVLTNTTAAIKIVRFYNKASAPVVGTDVPYFVLALPPNTVSEFASPLGRVFSVGIAYSITGAVADLDTTVTAANDVLGSVGYA